MIYRVILRPAILTRTQSSVSPSLLRLCGSLLLLLQVGLLPAKAQPLCPAQLEGAIAPIVNDPQFRRAHWGILVQTESNLLESNSPSTLYAQNAEKFFMPASNAKLLTTAAALTRLGSQFRIRTSVYQMVNRVGDQATANILRIVGHGDPSLTDRQLQDLARQIRDRGMTQIDRLILDDQYFRGDAINPTWEWEDIQAGYGASVNSLIVNQNAIGLTLVPQGLGEPLQVAWDDPNDGPHWQINNRSRTVATDQPEFLQVGRSFSQPTLQVEGQLRVGSAAEPIAISVPQPLAYFAARFQQALKAAGIQVKQTQVADDGMIDTAQPTQAIEIAAIESAPLAELLIETNQESNNLYAEAILRSLGINRSAQSTSSLEAGLSEVKTTLTQLGVSAAGYQLADGSGLSRRNLVSPAALVETLQAMERSPYALAYRNSLAVAGVSGTLHHRFQNTPVHGQLQGKTGFLSGAAALSGYLQPSGYPPVAFSIMVNQFDLSIGEVQPAIDRIVEILQSLKSC